MEVTRSNFSEVLPLIEKSLKNCDFISLDTEFTGLELPGESCSLFDSPSERYVKHKRAVNAFTLTQLGIACFRRDPECNKYESTVFNVSVFPTQFKELNATFTAQISSIEFLRRNQFDFNKFIYEGVPFLNRHDLYEVRSAMEKGLIDYHEIGAQQFADTCQLLMQWLSKAGAGNTTDVDLSHLETQLGRWIFKHELLRRFPQIRIKSSNGSKAVVEVCSENDIDLRTRQREDFLQSVLRELTGCAILFDMLVAVQKPIVGQNLLLDLMFLYEKFYDPLPDNYDVFKSHLLSLFPQIYDTKQVACSMRKLLDERGCKSFSLGGMNKFLVSSAENMRPYVALDGGAKKYETGQFHHEAGFDAFICGEAFIYLAHVKAMRSLLPTPTKPLSFLQHIEAVKCAANRLSLIGASTSYIDLNGSDPTSLRPDWMLVAMRHRFQKLDRSRLMADLACFGSFGVRPISSYKALVAVASHNTVQAVMENPHMCEKYWIKPYKGPIRSSYGSTFAVTTTLVAIGFLACAWTWKAVMGRSSIKT